MQEITAIKIEVREVRTLEDLSPEFSGDYGEEFTFRIYYSENRHLSRDEISKLFPMGSNNISIVKVI